MRGISWLVGFLVGLSGCMETGERESVSSPRSVSASEAETVPAVEDERFVGFALLPGGTVLRSRPDPDAPGARLPIRPHAPGQDQWASESAGVVVALHGFEGDYLRIDPFVSAAGQCETTLGEYEELDLRLYALRSRARLVTARPAQFEPGDGTSIHVAAGVPLESMPDGRWRARAFGVEVVLPIPFEALGYAYQPWSQRLQLDPTDRLPPETVLQFGARSVDGSAYLFGGEQGAYIYSAAPHVEERGWRVGVANECFDIQAWAVGVGPEDATIVRDRVWPLVPMDGVRPAPSVVRPGQGHQASRWPHVMRSAIHGQVVEPRPLDRYRVVERAVLYWDNGDPVGWAGRGFTLVDRPRPTGGRVCTDQALPGGGAMLHLCVDPEDVQGVLPRHVYARTPTGLPEVRVDAFAEAIQGWPIEDGALDLPGLNEALEERAGEVAHCYASALRYGLVEEAVTFEVRMDLRRSDGEVRGVVWDGDRDQAVTLNDCVAATIERWSLPELLTVERQKLSFGFRMSAVEPSSPANPGRTP